MNSEPPIPHGERLDRFHIPYQPFPPQNPFESYDSSHSHHQPLSHRFEQFPPDFSNERFGGAHVTYHRDVYSEPMHRRSNHKSKHSSLATSALALLAFLFFINILQSCLKEHMVSMNPTVMVMSAKRDNIRKTGLVPNKPYDTIKKLDESMDDTELGEATTRLPIAEETDTKLPIADHIDLQVDSPEELAYEEKTNDKDNENVNIDEYDSTKKR